MKKIIISLLAVVIVGAGGFYAYHVYQDSAQYNKVSLSEQTLAQAIENKENVKGRRIENLPLMVESIEEKGRGFQITASSKTDLNIQLQLKENPYGYQAGDYLLADGKIESLFSDGTVVIYATQTARSDETLFNPSRQTLAIGLTEEAGEVSVTLQKIEFAEQTTRLYVEVANRAGYPISIHADKLVMKQNEYAPSDSKEATFPASVGSNKTESGIMTLEAVDPHKIGPFQLTFGIDADGHEAQTVMFDVK